MFSMYNDLKFFADIDNISETLKVLLALGGDVNIVAAISRDNFSTDGLGETHPFREIRPLFLGKKVMQQDDEEEQA